MYHYMDNSVQDHALGGRHLTQSDNYVWLVPQPPSPPAASASAPQASPPIPTPVPPPIPAPSSSTSDNTALYVGLGVGIGGALLIGLALGLLIRWHLRRRRTPQQPNDTSKARARDSYPNYYHGSQTNPLLTRFISQDSSSKRSDFDEEKEDDLEMARYFTPRENPISGPGPYHIFNGPIPYPVPLNVDPGRDKLLHTAWNWPTFGNHTHAPFVMHPSGQTPSPPYVVAGSGSYPMTNGGPSTSWAMQHHPFEGGLRPFDTVDQGSVPYHPGTEVMAHHAVIVGQQHGQAVWVAANMLPITQAATTSQNAKPSYVMEEIVDGPAEEDDDNQASAETSAAAQFPVDPPQTKETQMDENIRPEIEGKHTQVLSTAAETCPSPLPTQKKSEKLAEEDSENGEQHGDGMPPSSVNHSTVDHGKTTLVDHRHALWALHDDEIDSIPLDSVASEEESTGIAPLPIRRILLQSDRPQAGNTAVDTCEIETVNDSMADDGSGGWSPPTPQRPDLDVSRVLSPPDHSTEKRAWRGPLGYDPSGLLTPYASEGPNSAREAGQEGISAPGMFMPRKRALLDTLQTVDIGVGRTFAGLNSQENLEDTLVDQEEWDRFCQFELRDIFTREHLTNRHNDASE